MQYYAVGIHRSSNTRSTVMAQNKCTSTRVRIANYYDYNYNKYYKYYNYYYN